MTPALRIVLADDERDMRNHFHKILPRLGHTVAAGHRLGADSYTENSSAHSARMA